MRNDPPKFSQWILGQFLNKTYQHPALGDLEEEFECLTHDLGVKKARRWYRHQVLKSIPRFFHHHIYWSASMLKNYLTVAFRNIKRHKVYSIINISGLTAGMVCCIFIVLWVQDELQFDRFHIHKHRIYRVISEVRNPGKVVHEAGTHAPLGPALKEEFPEIVDYTRFFLVDRQIIQYEDNVFKEDRFVFADPSILDIFSFNLVMGDPETALSEPPSVILTEQMSRKYFGEASPMGKVLQVENWGDLTVTGVITMPPNSHLQCDFLVPFECLGQSGFPLTGWSWSGFYTYVLLEEGADHQMVTDKISDVVMRHNENVDLRIFLQPLTRVHLHSWDLAFDNMNFSMGDIKTVQIFIPMALFILLIATINFMNLTTARTAIRAREVGMRKVIGAKRTNITRQFLGESVFMAFLAILLAVVLVLALMEPFNTLTGKALSVGSLANVNSILALFCITLVTGLLSGCYPALFLSAFQPVLILRGKMGSGRGGSLLRRILVVFQFTIAIGLIIGSIVGSNQLRFMKNLDLGYDKEFLISIQGPRTFSRRYESFKTSLLQNPNVLSVTTSMPSPISIGNWAVEDIEWEGKQPDQKVSVDPVYVGYDFFKTFRMEIIQGRAFSKDYSTDEAQAFLINEEAAKLMGLESPVGKKIVLEDNPGTIIGVVKDFHHRSLHNKIDPIVFRFGRAFEMVFIKLYSGNVDRTLKFIENIWNELEPHHPFAYHFLSDSLDHMYKAETRLGRLFRYFTFLAIIISCLGLLGLSSFMAERRTKEIGIRKVLGASVSGLVKLLSKEFLVLVCLANIIAWPVAFFVMNQWLQQFAYRVGWGMNVFLLSGLLTLVIALFTVSYQAVKSATANPVESLRNEG